MLTEEQLNGIHRRLLDVIARLGADALVKLNTDELSELLAAARRDADVSTLDEWASKDQMCRSWTVGCEDEHGIFGLALHDGYAPRLAGTGPSPSEARHAAASAVRKETR